VTRSANARDRREAPLSLTAAGRRVYEQLVPIVLAYQERLLASLSAGERRTLEQLLDKLERRLALPCRPERPGPHRHADAAALPEVGVRPSAAD
jgi:hypothetical protein